MHLICLCTFCVLTLTNNYSGKKKKQATLSASPCLLSSKFCISSLILQISLLILDIPPVLIWTSKRYSYPKYPQSEALASQLTVIYNLKRSLISCLQEILWIKNKTYIYAPIYTYTWGPGFRIIDCLETWFSDLDFILSGASHIYFYFHIRRAAIWLAKVYI